MHFGYGFYIHDYSFLSLSLSLINSDPVWQQLPLCLPGIYFFHICCDGAELATIHNSV